MVLFLELSTLKRRGLLVINNKDCFMKRKYFLILGLAIFCFFIPDVIAAGGVKLPTYATGTDAGTQTQTIGKKIADFLSIAIGVLGGLGMLAGAVMISTGISADKGKQVFGYSLGGVALGGLVYGIMALVI